jgi:hypothetical protein
MFANIFGLVKYPPMGQISQNQGQTPQNQSQTHKTLDLLAII